MGEAAKWIPVQRPTSAATFSATAPASLQTWRLTDHSRIATVNEFVGWDGNERQGVDVVADQFTGMPMSPATRPGVSIVKLQDRTCGWVSASTTIPRVESVLNDRQASTWATAARSQGEHGTAHDPGGIQLLVLRRVPSLSPNQEPCRGRLGAARPS